MSPPARLRRRRTPEHNRKIAAAVKAERNGNWKGERASYKAIHKWLGETFPKLGVCEECQASDRKTAFAFRHHPRPPTRLREDYRELCWSCHHRADWQLVPEHLRVWRGKRPKYEHPDEPEVIRLGEEAEIAASGRLSVRAQAATDPTA